MKVKQEGRMRDEMSRKKTRRVEWGWNERLLRLVGDKTYNQLPVNSNSLNLIEGPTKRRKANSIPSHTKEKEKGFMD